MQESHFPYSQTRLLIVVVLLAVIFGFSGYWYGSRNPGGFTLGPSPVNDMLNIDQGPARDHPGSITMNIYSGLMEYKNDFIGFNFQFPQGWFVEDKWLGDATDLTILGNTLQKQVDLNSKKQTSPYFSQLEITYISDIEILDSRNKKVENLDEFVQEYSKEYKQALGASDPPQFTSPQSFPVGNLEGFKAENSEGNGGGKIYLVKASKGYFEITMRPDSDLTEDVQNTILSNLQFN